MSSGRLGTNEGSFEFRGEEHRAWPDMFSIGIALCVAFLPVKRKKK